MQAPSFRTELLTYDDYTNGGANLNLLQGNVGLGYSF